MATDTLDRPSISEVLRASAILLVRIAGMQTDPWHLSADKGWQVCQAHLTLELEEVLKGKVQQQPGESFALTVTLRDSLRPQGDPGPWSRQPLTTGQQLVAFCEGAADDARVLLAEEHCETLLAAEMVLNDVQCAMALERSRSSVSRILDKAQKNTANLGDIFARYVWAKTLPRGEEAQFQAVGLAPLVGGESASFDRKTEAAGQVFARLMELLAGAPTDERARAAYLACAMNTINLMSPPPWNWEIHLIRALFTLLELPQAAAQRSAVGQVYLPNLLGLHGPSPRYQTEEIFGETGEAARYLDALDRGQLDPALIRWLEGKDK
jgi:hypothetical protein